jgi:hypothetical protein
VRKLLLDSLQEIVNSRKHQRQSKKYNQNYDQIIKDTANNRTLKIEKSIPASEHSPDFDPTSNIFQPEQLIVSRGDLSLELSH